MKKTNLRFYLTIGALFILAGGLLGTQLFQHAQTNNGGPSFKPAIVSAAPAPATSTATISGEPINISIPSLNISLAVERGYYNAPKQTWTLSNTKANYAAVTALPNNQSGNTFIYGHNKVGVFKDLMKISPGAIAHISTSNGHGFTYQLADVRDTKPTDTSLFAYTGKPILTLQTCSGSFYQNRRLFTFNLIEAK